MITILHSPAIDPKLHIKTEVSIYVPNNLIYFIPESGFTLVNVTHKQYIQYPKWVSRFLTCFGIKGKIIHYKGYTL